MKSFAIAVALIFLRVYVGDAVDIPSGDSAILSCNINTQLRIRWQKYFEMWHILTDDSTGKYQGTETIVLTITNVQKADSGNYRCVSISSAGGFVDYDNHKTVRVLAVVIVLYGTNTTMTCISNGASYRWLKWNGDSYQLLPYSTRYSYSMKSLTIQNTIVDDSGRYQCVIMKNQIVELGREVPIALQVQVNGDWTFWGSWDACTVTCGTGEKSRKRNCTNPIPQHGGNNCIGEAYDNQTCKLPACKVDGSWSPWNTVVACTVTCGIGQQSRKRNCNSPMPANGGANCQGEEYDNSSCTLSACPVDGGWSSWINFGDCNVTCGTGQQRRRRYCNSPTPAHSGDSCEGEEYDYISCTPSSCAESKTTAVAPIAGGVGGGLFLLVIIVVVGLIYIKRKRRKSLDDRISRENQRLQIVDRKVSIRQGVDRQEGMYINIARASCQSSSDTDDVTPSRASRIDNTTDESTTYCNNSDILTTVKIEELKDYIKRKQVNEGLHSEYKTFPYGPQYPTTIAQKKENMPKNRFKTTFPYDHTRVILQAVSGSSEMDYINANFVDGFEKESCYIASQGPLKHTFIDFWTIIWQNNTRKIIMLTNLMEVAKVKCDKYWPEGGKPMVLGNLILTLQSEKERAAYVTREISVENKKTKEKRNIIQYHFTAWPDHGTPDPLYLVLFHKHVISDHSDVESGKLLVHCSAGIGRTGTYIGLDALFDEGRVTGCVDIVKFVKKMRYSRMNMVQTPDQYVCLHYALLEAFTMKDTNIGKEEFGTIWREIQSDKQPINHRKLYKEFKMLEAKKSEHGKSEYTTAISPENMKKNRNKSVIPSDNNRLFLTTYDKGRTDYINAVQAPSYTKFVGYLTTQLPLPDTKIDFWTMIRDHNSSTVVMFINEQPEAELVYATTEDAFSCGSFTMKITRREKEEFDISSCTVVLSRKDEKSREIVIYCAVCSGYPKPNVLCKLVNMISTRVSMSHDAVTVVSGDGAKNCGLFCTFSNAVSSMTIDDNADIFQLARLLQLRRPEFFADFEEYRLCYEALNFYLESSNVYANF